MLRCMLVSVLVAFALACAPCAQAQPSKLPRVGVLTEGGVYEEALVGLKEGLRELGLEDGRHYMLEVRDTHGDVRAVPSAARSLELAKVQLIYVVATSVAVPTKEATTVVPIVFAVGRDPVAAGLVESFAKPGGRLTGVHFLSADLTAKRLEILKAVLPELRRAVTFYNPANATAQDSSRMGREAARRLGIDLVERHVASPEALLQAVLALKPGEVDAIFYTNEAMVTSQSQAIIEIANRKKLPTSFPSPTSAVQGALLTYGVSYRDAGHLSAKYVQRILAGTQPRDLPVESFSKPRFVINLKVARELGITIPKTVLLQADQVIE